MSSVQLSSTALAAAHELLDELNNMIIEQNCVDATIEKMANSLYDMILNDRLNSHYNGFAELVNKTLKYVNKITDPAKTEIITLPAPRVLQLSRVYYELCGFCDLTSHDLTGFTIEGYIDIIAELLLHVFDYM